MWLGLSVMLCAVLAGLMAWLLPRWLWGWSQKQQHHLHQTTERFFIAHFLFINSKAVLGALLFGLVFAAVVLVVLGVPWLVVLLIAGAVLLVWPLYLRSLHTRRVLRFEKQFPDFLLGLASALQAGSSLRSCLARVAQLSDAPLRQEMELLLKEQRMGLSLSQALDSLHGRLQCESTALFRSALVVAGQSGGGLADLLQNMASTISTRLYIEGRIKTLTAQGRLQAWVMVLLPVFVGMALHWLDPSLIAPLWQQRSGQIVLTIIVLLEGLGLWWIQRLTTISI